MQSLRFVINIAQVLFRFQVSAVWKKQNCFFSDHPLVKLSILGSLRDQEVACSASDLQGLNFEFCVWRPVSSHSSHHPQEVLLVQFSLYAHKSGLKPDSFYLFCFQYLLGSALATSYLNNIGSLERTLQYYCHATPGLPLQGSSGVAW